MRESSICKPGAWPARLRPGGSKQAPVPAPNCLIIVLGLLLTTACQGTGAEQPNGAADPLRGTTVEIAGFWTDDEQATLKKALVRFEQETGVSVRYTPTGPDIGAELRMRFERGSPPGVAVLSHPGLLADLALGGMVKPLGDRMEDLVEDDYGPAWRNLGSVNGTLYGVWVEAVNKSTIWYNARSLHQAGVDPPATWDEFLQASRRLATAGITPLSIAGGDGWPLTDWFENVYLRVAGPERYDELSRHDIPWTDESVKAALSLLADLWGDPDLIVEGATTARLMRSVTQLFADPPKGAMAYGGGGTDKGSAMAGEEVGLFEFPSIEGARKVVVGQGKVAVRLADDAAAAALVEFLASPKAGDVLVESGGFISPNKRVNVNFYPDEVTRQAARALVDADVFRFDLSDLQPPAFGGTPGQGLWKILHDFLADPSDIDGTARQLEAAALGAFDR